MIRAGLDDYGLQKVRMLARWKGDLEKESSPFFNSVFPKPYEDHSEIQEEFRSANLVSF